MKDKIREMALVLLGKREMSAFELNKKIAQKIPQASPQEIQEILEEFIQKNWLSDERFCENFIQHQVLTLRAGPFQIAQKLKHKGIEETLITKMIKKHFPSQDQTSLALSLAQKKQQEILSRGKKEAPQVVQQKILRYLVGKGYSFEVAKSVVEEM